MFRVRFRPGLLSSGFKRPGFGVRGSNRPTSTSSGFKMDFFIVSIGISYGSFDTLFLDFILLDVFQVILFSWYLCLLRVSYFQLASYLACVV